MPITKRGVSLMPQDKKKRDPQLIPESLKYSLFDVPEGVDMTAAGDEEKTIEGSGAPNRAGYTELADQVRVFDNEGNLTTRQIGVHTFHFRRLALFYWLRAQSWSSLITASFLLYLIILMVITVMYRVWGWYCGAGVNFISSFYFTVVSLAANGGYMGEDEDTMTDPSNRCYSGRTFIVMICSYINIIFVGLVAALVVGKAEYTGKISNRIVFSEFCTLTAVAGRVDAWRLSFRMANMQNLKPTSQGRLRLFCVTTESLTDYKEQQRAIAKRERQQKWQSIYKNDKVTASQKPLTLDLLKQQAEVERARVSHDPTVRDLIKVKEVVQSKKQRRTRGKGDDERNQRRKQKTKSKKEQRKQRTQSPPSDKDIDEPPKSLKNSFAAPGNPELLAALVPPDRRQHMKPPLGRREGRAEHHSSSPDVGGAGSPSHSPSTDQLSGKKGGGKGKSTTTTSTKRGLGRRGGQRSASNGSDSVGSSAASSRSFSSSSSSSSSSASSSSSSTLASDIDSARTNSSLSTNSSRSEGHSPLSGAATAGGFSTTVGGGGGGASTSTGYGAIDNTAMVSAASLHKTAGKAFERVRIQVNELQWECAEEKYLDKGAGGQLSLWYPCTITHHIDERSPLFRFMEGPRQHYTGSVEDPSAGSPTVPRGGSSGFVSSLGRAVGSLVRSGGGGGGGGGRDQRFSRGKFQLVAVFDAKEMETMADIMAKHTYTTSDIVMHHRFSNKLVYMQPDSKEVLLDYHYFNVVLPLMAIESSSSESD